MQHERFGGSAGDERRRNHTCAEQQQIFPHGSAGRSRHAERLCGGNGWPERFTEKSLGRLIPTRETAAFSRMIVDMLYHALRAEDDPGENEMEEDNEKNAETSQSK